MSQLPLTDQIDALIAEGRLSEAEELRTEVTNAAFENAQAGAIINLSDLIAGAEQLHIARCEWSPEQISPTEPRS